MDLILNKNGPSLILPFLLLHQFHSSENMLVVGSVANPDSVFLGTPDSDPAKKGSGSGKKRIRKQAPLIQIFPCTYL